MTETTEIKKDVAKSEVKTEAKKTTPKPEKKATADLKVAKAHLKTIRMTARKVRLVIDLVRGKSLKEAIDILGTTHKRAAEPVKKLILSAAANAVNNHGMNEDKLFISKIWANESITMKRFMTRAKGSSSQILKRTSHIDVELQER